MTGGTPSRWRPAARGLLLALALLLVLAAGSELALRLAGRVGSGAWPRTRAELTAERRARLAHLFRLHPFLGVAPREGAAVELGGKRASFNSAGYRSPERPVARPPGIRRVVCAGGSTTFDSLAPDDRSTWPWRLEDRLRARGVEVEVWNAGVPGWTSLESVVSLLTRDLDLQPDLVVFYHGINDLQPASHHPFEADYETGHAELVRRALGLTSPAPGILGHSLLLDRLRAAPAPPSPPPGGGSLAPGALAAFRRNVRSFVAVARAGGAATLLVTQPIRLRAGQRRADEAYLEEWIPTLSGEVAARQIERFNDVLRRQACPQGPFLADAARGIEWSDADFGDPVHYTRQGAEKLSRFLADRIAPLLGRLGADGAPRPPGCAAGAPR